MNLSLEEAKAIVRERYPHAWEDEEMHPSGLKRFIRDGTTRRITGRCNTLKAAWLSAARRIQKEAERKS